MQEYFSSPPVVITKTSQLEELVAQLSNEPAIAIDTESNSLYAYQEQVCLMQFSIPGTDFLVDPLSGLNLGALGDVFANPQVQKVFHAAEYDVMCLRRDFGWTFENLFDTMWAARVLGWPRVGLGNILKENFGVRMSKRWQRHNWGSRPLSSEALTYARLDTHYLLPLRERMLNELQAMGRLEEAREFFVEVAQSEPTFTAFDPDVDLWKVKGVWDLDPDSWAVLRELLIWRDQEARRRDRPHFKIVNDRVLTDLAATRPEHISQIREIRGFKQHHRRRYGHKIVQAVARGLEASPPRRPPRPSRPPEEVTERYEALRSWRKKVASQRGVDPDVVVSNATLRELAHHVPDSLDQLSGLDGLGPWKQRKYGQALLRVLRKCC